MLSCFGVGRVGLIGFDAVYHIRKRLRMSSVIFHVLQNNFMGVKHNETRY